MIRASLLLVLVGCATSYQSARPLEAGKMEVTIAASRTETISESDDDSLWVGDLMVRNGAGKNGDVGVRLTRNPGIGDNLSLLAVDGKFALTEREAKTTLSIGLPVGIMWGEEGDDFEYAALLLTPTVFIGVQMGPTAEIVFAPKLFVIMPEDGDTETEVGGSLGFRFTDERRSYAIHPEVGFLHVSEGDGETFMMFGIGVSAGN